MPTVAVAVPWQPGCPHREAAWAFVKPLWPWPVIEGTNSGPWCKANAVMDALDRTDADIVVVADADVWADTTLAVEAVAAGAGWAMPHRFVHRLTATATEQVLAGGELGGDVEQKPYRGMAGGGIVVLRRCTALDVPLDPRFVGWGQEDKSWAAALSTFHGGPWRGSEPLWHLWHPPQARMSRTIGSRASEALWHRYRRAQHRPDAMRALLEEAHGCPHRAQQRSHR